MELSNEEQFLIEMIRKQNYATLTIRVEQGRITGKVKSEITHNIKELIVNNIEFKI